VVKISNVFLHKNTIKIVELFVFLFGLFVLYQVIRKIVGGSWSVEDLILSMLVLNFGCIFTLGLMVTRIKSDHPHLKSQFRSMAHDFKSQKHELQKRGVTK